MQKGKKVVDIIIAVLNMALYATASTLSIIYFAPILFLQVSSAAPKAIGFSLFITELGQMIICLFLVSILVWFGLSLALLVFTIKKRQMSTKHTVSVLVDYVLLLSLCLSATSFASPLTIAGAIIILTVVMLCISSLMLNRKTQISQLQPQLPPTPPQPVSKTIQEKILELKRLKELGFISEQQYSDAITQIINLSANR